MKRGRPKIATDEKTAFYNSLFPDIETRRGIQNQMYAAAGLGTLKEYDDETGDNLHEYFIVGRHMKTSLLSELGRWPESERVEMAKHIRDSEESYTVKDWIHAMRKVRISEAASENTDSPC